MRDFLQGPVGWECPGTEVLELLGYGSAGEVWRARCGADLVVLRRLNGRLLSRLNRTDRDLVAEIRAQATTVRALPTEHLIRLRTVKRAQGDDVLVLDYAAGGSLDALLARRGTLRPGEVVTVLAPLAEALGQAHAQALYHRRLGARRVLFSGDGKPLLDGLGLDALYDPKDSLDPTGALGSTADVWALGALGRLLLSAEPPGGTPLKELVPAAPVPLVTAIESALAFEPGARPSAAEFAVAVLAACPPAALEGLPSSPAPVRQPGSPVSLRAAATETGARSGLGGATPGQKGSPGPGSTAGSAPALQLSFTAGSGARAGVRPGAGLGASSRAGSRAGAQAGFPPGSQPESPAGSQKGFSTAVARTRPAVRGKGRSRRTSSARLGLVAALALTVVVILGWTWGTRSSESGATVAAVPATTSGATPEASATVSAAGFYWTSVVRQLDAARGKAFATGSPAALSRVYAPGSPGLKQDALALNDLVERDATAHGLAHRIVLVVPVSVGTDRTVIKVTEALDAYALVGRDGSVLERHTAGPVQTAEMTLVRETAGWRLQVVRRAP